MTGQFANTLTSLASPAGYSRPKASTRSILHSMRITERPAKESAGARRKMSIGGWACIAIFVGLLSGLMVAYKTGHESTGFLFGMALMVFLPLAFLYAVVEAIASRLRKSR